MSVPVYTIEADHPLISQKLAKYVDDPAPAPDDRFTMQQIIAESLLGARSPAFTGDNATVAVIAIVRQMNFQVEAGLDPLIQASASSGQAKQSVVYRDRNLDPVAAMLWEGIGTEGIDQLLAKFSGVLRSVRTDGVRFRHSHDPNCSDRSLESRRWRHGY